jgi:hypothetical protein
MLKNMNGFFVMHFPLPSMGFRIGAFDKLSYRCLRQAQAPAYLQAQAPKLSTNTREVPEPVEGPT